MDTPQRAAGLGLAVASRRDLIVVAAPGTVQHSQRQNPLGARREHGGHCGCDLVAGHLDAGVGHHDRSAGTQFEGLCPIDQRQQCWRAQPLALGPVVLLPLEGGVHTPSLPHC